MDHGVASHEIVYLKGLGDPSTLEAVEEALSKPKLKVIGAVVDKVDRIMHGMELGAAGMHNQVRQWAAEGFLSCAFGSACSQTDSLCFSLPIMAMWSPLAAEGRKRGSPLTFVGNARGSIPTPVLRANVAARFPAAISWKPIGLPENFLPLLSADRSAFVQEGHRTVAHGGITLEETIVPFIRVVGGKS